MGASGNRLVGNLATENGERGYLLWLAAANNILTDNTASRNKSVGFLVASSSANTLTGNTASGNGTSGFVVRVSLTPTATHSRGTLNREPRARIQISDNSSDSELRDNNATANGR